MSIDIPVPEPVLWHDPASLPERVLRAFERHKDWVPTQYDWLAVIGDHVFCCGLAALYRDSPERRRSGDTGHLHIRTLLGYPKRDAFQAGFDAIYHFQPHHSKGEKAYGEAGKRAWELVKPLAEQRRRELNV